jgi:hypothetical protein
MTSPEPDRVVQWKRKVSVLSSHDFGATKQNWIACSVEAENSKPVTMTSLVANSAEKALAPLVVRATQADALIGTICVP